MTILRPVLLAVGCVVLAACQSPPAAQTGAAYMLLGEVHDNPAAHAARLELLKQRIGAGWRPAIAMEQFDREHQPQLDAALRACGDADCVIGRAAPGKSGWQWPLYQPLIEMALQHRLPIIAANLSRGDAGKVMKSGYGAALDQAQIARFGLPDAIPTSLQKAQNNAVRDGHCGKLPEAMVPLMAQAQIARDVVMADALLRQNGDVVLIAGNGHVRNDIGVGFWLRNAGAKNVQSMGFVEHRTSGFDRQITVTAHDRPDPCATL